MADEFESAPIPSEPPGDLQDPIRRFGRAVDEMAESMDRHAASSVMGGLGIVLIAFAVLSRVDFGTGHELERFSTTELMAMLGAGLLLIGLAAAFRFIAWELGEETASGYRDWQIGEVKAATKAREAAVAAVNETETERRRALDQPRIPQL
jgi:hypothetical protein